VGVCSFSSMVPCHDGAVYKALVTAIDEIAFNRGTRKRAHNTHTHTHTHTHSMFVHLTFTRRSLPRAG